MDAILDLLHRLHDVEGIIRWGGLVMIVAIVFAETGLLVGFFLPGDSLLVTAGIFAAAGHLNIALLLLTVTTAAIVGDQVGYFIGYQTGSRIFSRPDSRFFRRDHLLRTQAFYDKYGGVTIIIGRFVPIIRTFAPFLTGVAGMSYHRFFAFNVVGGIVWVASLVYAGYVFGNIPWVKDNLTLIVIGIVAVSLIPVATTFLKERRARKA